MHRISCEPRKNWKQKNEELGFLFHTDENVYWDESVYYQFTAGQIEILESATEELYARCLDAVKYVIENDLFQKFRIPEHVTGMIKKSWNEKLPSLYGRFDLAFDGVNPPKMLEFNADTPTSLFEAAIIQWYWLEDKFPGNDQFNSIHEKLVEGWKKNAGFFEEHPVYFTGLSQQLEDFVTIQYIRDCCIQAGLKTEFIPIEEIGWSDAGNCFVDQNDIPIYNIFKLYPFEWMFEEEFSKNLVQDSIPAVWIEPPWKAILSNKSILPVLWELFPHHKNLLPANFEEGRIHSSTIVKKPVFSREGANVKIYSSAMTLEETSGEYGKEGYIYQEYYKLPEFSGNFPVIGSWVIDHQSAGIGIRESKTRITTNTSRFVPHLISS
jgi:glutathionylspermidine synthase